MTAARAQSGAMRAIGVAMTITAGLALLAMPARAAVRLCMPQVSSGLQEAASERQARARAMAAWTTAASAHGPPFTSWRLAAGKFLACAPRPGGFGCLARAAPCAISNVPPPPGTLQPRRPQGVDG